jgi:Cu-processing system ATP-binding protein
MNATTTFTGEMTSTVELKNVSKIFGAIHAVRDVSFALGEGEIVALVGHNGAGKTTIIKMMLGLARPSSGSVRILGGCSSDAAGVRARIGYLPENVSFNPMLSGRETLQFYAALKRAESSQIEELLARVGLMKAARQRVRTYSKGMRQRLGLAQALLGKPKVLLLDEPTTGLDPASRRDFYQLLEELRQSGATIMLSSHALSELEGRTDHVIIMSRGRKVADGTLESLRQMARLPTRIRVRLADGGDRKTFAGDWRPVNGRTMEIDAAPEQKLALVRSAVGAAISDLDVRAPTLDELYAHFQDYQQDLEEVER